jgi:hypothetical protein
MPKPSVLAGATNRQPAVSLAVLGIAALVLLAPRPASAAIFPVGATLEIAFGGIATGSFTGGAPAASSAGQGGAATLPAGSLSGVFSTALSPPLFTLIDGFGIAAPGLSGPFVGAAPIGHPALNFGAAFGYMGLNAGAYLLMGGSAVAEIPLATVGSGGTQMFHALSLSFGAIFGNPYQLGMLTLMGSLNTVPHTLMGTGVDDRTAGGKGTLVLVTPTMVYLGAVGSVASISTLTLQYVPEPGTSLLVTCGVLGFALAGRRRNRS